MLMQSFCKKWLFLSQKWAQSSLWPCPTKAAGKQPRTSASSEASTTTSGSKCWLDAELAFFVTEMVLKYPLQNQREKKREHSSREGIRKSSKIQFEFLARKGSREAFFSLCSQYVFRIAKTACFCCKMCICHPSKTFFVK